MFDSFTKLDFVYPHAVATVKVGKGVKSENELIIAGTKGYIYVPAPWWNIDDDFYEEIEETLIMGDLGIQTCTMVENRLF